MSTVFHAAYWAHSLRLAYPRDQVASLTRSLGNARVDLNPHQIDAALFALRSPFTRGVLLADEVGLGKTIEASLVMAQKWAERRRRLLLISPATLRKQWQGELWQKFFLPTRILETKAWNDLVRQGVSNPFDVPGEPAVVICSYQFAFARRAELAQVAWDLVVVDEAHRLRSYHKGSRTAVGIAEAIDGRRKVFLTATPLQNSLLELYGLVKILDPDIFGDVEQFQAQFAGRDALLDVDARNASLRTRLQPVCKRTLRRDVQAFVKFTERHAVTAEFTSTPAEQQLYDEVSRFLQRDELLVLPTAQRPLMTLVLRKLLASSTRAIAATLGRFIDRVEGANLAEDYEVEDEPVAEDPSQEVGDGGSDADASSVASDDSATVVPATPVPPDPGLGSELADLRRFIELARGVAQDSKAEKLIEALPTVFDSAAALGAQRKAVIFTESRKTQAYLAELLAENGYAGQIVLLNGTNSDPLSRQTYASWKQRHAARWQEVSSGSKTADMKAAIVEEFRDRGTILLATESAAEGVNLQFCSVVVNYDLPWNPQRIEQRIGRCHRYGQKSDVLVVNFVNTSNQADRRVYELLNQKLRLFDGVFGASDDVLGATASGLDLEAEIVSIYQSCRTNEEIDAAFDELQAELDGLISTGRRRARQAVIEHFDANIQANLAIYRDEAKRALDEQQSWLLDLARFGWRDRATFAEAEPRFTMVVDGVDKRFNLDWRDAETREEEFFRVDHELAAELIEGAARTVLPAREVVFTYATHASALVGQVGRSGWLELSRVTVSALDQPEVSLLVAACNDDGELLPPDVAARLFSLDAVVDEECGEVGPAPEALVALHGELVRERVQAFDARSRRLLEEESEKIERTTEDQKRAVLRALDQLEADMKAAQKEARSALSFDDQVAAKRRVDELKRQLRDARARQYEDIERLEQQQDDLTARIQEALRDRTVTETPIATLRWRLVAPAPTS